MGEPISREAELESGEMNRSDGPTFKDVFNEAHTDSNITSMSGGSVVDRELKRRTMDVT